MIVCRRTRGGSRWCRRRVDVFDSEEVGGLAEGKEGSFDDGTGD